MFRVPAALAFALAVLLALAAAPARAVPPVSLAAADQAAVEAYMTAVAANDHAAYVRLFAPDARIVSDWPQASDRDAWLAATAQEFGPARTVRFLAVFGDHRRVLLVQELQHCRPGIAECFGQFRTEVLTLRDGRITALERTRYTHRRLQPRDWTFFYR